MARGINPHAFAIDVLKTLFIGTCKAFLRKSMCLPDGIWRVTKTLGALFIGPGLKLAAEKSDDACRLLTIPQANRRTPTGRFLSYAF